MLRKFMMSLLLVLVPAIAQAAESKGSAEEAIAMLERAVTLYEAEGVDALAAAISNKDNSDFHDRDLYVIISEIDGPILYHGANPKANGKDMSFIKDVNGFAFVKEISRVAREQGEGWVDYFWTNPTSGLIEAKSTKVVRLNEKYYAAVGIYKQ